MTRRFFPGGTYVDALPSGAFAVLVPGTHLQTHLGVIALPPGDEPLYHRITEIGGFQIAGQAHFSASTWHWRGGAWRRLPAACGISPVIFDAQGELHISDCSIGSQGYRYVTEAGGLVTGDDTYSSVFGLSEWSQYRDLSIGQGHDGGGVQVWDGQQRRLLETGDCRFVRVQGAGETVAVAFWKVGAGAVIIRATLTELRALPLIDTPTPTPLPPPPPPGKDMIMAPNLLSTVQRVMREHPEINTLDDATRGRVLDYVCAASNPPQTDRPWGRKSRNRDGTDLNTDGLTYLRPDGRFEIIDVISGVDGSATWDVAGVFAPGENGFWVPALPVIAPPTDDASNSSPPAPDVSAALGALRAQFEAHEARTAAAVADLREAIGAVARAIESRPPAPVVFPTYRGTAKLGTTMRFTLEPQP